MKPYRVYAGGRYEIYGRDGDAPWKLAPDKLDLSLSLGTGKLGSDTWTAGLRDNGEVCETQIAAYTDRWRSKADVPRPQILVLGERNAKGEYNGHYTFTVVDGAMWVAAAKKAGVELVPVSVVHPVEPIAPAAMWLYFNSVTNGLAPTERQRRRIITELAMQAREDGHVDNPAAWSALCALLTATPVRSVIEMTKGKFTTYRSDEQRAEDLETFQAEVRRRQDAGESCRGIVAWSARKIGKTKTAVRKWLKTEGVEIPHDHETTSQHAAHITTGANGHPIAAAPARATGVTAAAAAATNGHISGHTGELRTLEALLADAVAAPAVQKLIDYVERLTNSDNPEDPALAERPEARAEAANIWTAPLDILWAGLLRLGYLLNVHGDPDRAHRDARALSGMSGLACETLRRYRDPLAVQLKSPQAGKQMSLHM